MTETNISTNADGVAIGGYDAVSYFTDSQARLGTPDHSTEWSEATWHFASAENAATFAGDPERYAPQFGGHCAFGASMGKSAEASPDSWRMIDGKLCLMKSSGVKTLSSLFTGRIAKKMKSS